MTLKDDLLAAADKLEADGWFKLGPDEKQNPDRHRKEANCLVTVFGAIDISFEERAQALVAVAKHFGIEGDDYRDVYWDLVKWNDAKGRTKAEVIAALRQAAEKASTSLERGLADSAAGRTVDLGSFAQYVEED